MRRASLEKTPTAPRARAADGRLILLALVAFITCYNGARTAAIRVQSESDLRGAVCRHSAVILLPPRPIVLKRGITIPSSAAITILGTAGSALRAVPPFQGTILTAVNPQRLVLRNFSIDGGRPERPAASEMPPSEVPFVDFYKTNGIVVSGGHNVVIADVRLDHVTDFPVIVSGARGVTIHKVSIANSGSLNTRGRNNTSGGILLEQAVSDFEVSGCSLRNVRGNGIWTHSTASAGRSSGGRIIGNDIERAGRDAIQVGHATQVVVAANTGREIGFPASEVDIENQAIPVAIDTSGNVDASSYVRNRFEKVDGTCINLDGFHDGAVRENICRNPRTGEVYPYLHFGIVLDNSNPAMQSRNIDISDNTIVGAAYGGLFLIGQGHKVVGNRFLDLNRDHCVGDFRAPACRYALDQPDMLRSGIYLAAGANRKDPARGNLITGNEISGFGMGKWCIQMARTVRPRDNEISGNTCIETVSK